MPNTKNITSIVKNYSNLKPVPVPVPKPIHEFMSVLNFSLSRLYYRTVGKRRVYSLFLEVKQFAQYERFFLVNEIFKSHFDGVTFRDHLTCVEVKFYLKDEND